MSLDVHSTAASDNSHILSLQDVCLVNFSIGVDNVIISAYCNEKKKREIEGAFEVDLITLFKNYTF